METKEHLSNEEQDPFALGRVLHLRLQPAERPVWVGAGWAAICGIVATGSVPLNADGITRALLTLFLADPVLGAAWMALLKARDFSLISQNQSAIDDLNLKPAVISFWTSVAAGIGEQPTIQRLDQRYLEIGLACALALLLGVVLGQGVAIAVALGLLFPLIAWFALGGHALQASATRATLDIGLPWTIGVAAFTTFPTVDPAQGLPDLTQAIVVWVGEQVIPLAVGWLLAVAHYGILRADRPWPVMGRRVLINLPQFLILILVTVWQQPILAGIAILLVASQTLFQPYLQGHRARWYLYNTQWMCMGVMLIAAISVASQR